eukprot:g3065.t1
MDNNDLMDVDEERAKESSEEVEELTSSEDDADDDDDFEIESSESETEEEEDSDSEVEYGDFSSTRTSTRRLGVARVNYAEVNEDGKRVKHKRKKHKKKKYTKKKKSETVQTLRKLQREIPEPGQKYVLSMERILGRRELGQEGMTPSSVRHAMTSSPSSPRHGSPRKAVYKEQYLIKWKNKSHLHATWEDASVMSLWFPKGPAKWKQAITMFLKKQEKLIWSGGVVEEFGFNPEFAEPEKLLEMKVFPNPTVETMESMAEKKDDAISVDGLEVKMDNTQPQLSLSLGNVEEESSVDPNVSAVKKYEARIQKLGRRLGCIPPAPTGRWFLVKWHGLQHEECTWESEVDLKSTATFREALERFELQRSVVQSAPPPKRPSPSMYKELKVSPVYAERPGPNGKVIKFQLRDYQLIGLNWLLFNWFNRRPSILADEMGLGKTIQTIAFLRALSEQNNVKGPFLIIGPLSCAKQWCREISEWWPSANTILYHGNAASRKIIQNYEWRDRNSLNGKEKFRFQVVVTTYEMSIKDAGFLRRVPFQCVVVDEAHRLKNPESKLAIELMQYERAHVVLLTGTPLQNNMTELWAILHFCDPRRFSNLEYFLSQFGNLENDGHKAVSKLHSVLKPYLLRRLKEDVEKNLPPKEETVIKVPLMPLQKQYYRAIYERNTEFLYKGASAANGPSLMNVVMELRKCCNHPYLIRGAEAWLTSGIDERDTKALFNRMSEVSGKLVLLNKLLPKLRADGHKVLIFSQMVRMLNILHDYAVYNGFNIERIDGSIRGSERQKSIDRYMQNADSFLMLLSTRAGGVGINLTAADTVIIFDSDWNPQNDIQAMARAHRIGQTKAVKVYRLLTEKTFEVEMFERASMKLGLDKAVLSNVNDGKKNAAKMKLSTKEVDGLLKRGAYSLFQDEADAASKQFCDGDIDAILARSSFVMKEDKDEQEKRSAANKFSTASFVSTAAGDVDIDDPEFWKKTAGLDAPEEEMKTSKLLSLLGDDDDGQFTDFEELSDDELDEFSVPKEEKEDSRLLEVELAKWGYGRWNKFSVEFENEDSLSGKKINDALRCATEEVIKGYYDVACGAIKEFESEARMKPLMKRILSSKSTANNEVKTKKKCFLAETKPSRAAHAIDRQEMLWHLQQLVRRAVLKQISDIAAGSEALEEAINGISDGVLDGALLCKDLQKFACASVKSSGYNRPAFWWGKEEDGALLLGLFLYGWDGHDEMRKDGRLCLHKKYEELRKATSVYTDIDAAKTLEETTEERDKREAAEEAAHAEAIALQRKVEEEKWNRIEENRIAQLKKSMHSHVNGGAVTDANLQKRTEPEGGWKWKQIPPYRPKRSQLVPWPKKESLNQYARWLLSREKISAGNKRAEARRARSEKRQLDALRKIAITKAMTESDWSKSETSALVKALCQLGAPPDTPEARGDAQVKKQEEEDAKKEENEACMDKKSEETGDDEEDLEGWARVVQLAGLKKSKNSVETARYFYDEIFPHAKEIVRVNPLPKNQGAVTLMPQLSVQDYSDKGVRAARKLVDRVNLLKALRTMCGSPPSEEKGKYEEGLIKFLRFAMDVEDVPVWWVPEIHDLYILHVIAQTGFGKVNRNGKRSEICDSERLLYDPKSPFFRETLKVHVRSELERANGANLFRKFNPQIASAEFAPLLNGKIDEWIESVSMPLELPSFKVFLKRLRRILTGVSTTIPSSLSPSSLASTSSTISDSAKLIYAPLPSPRKSPSSKKGNSRSSSSLAASIAKKNLFKIKEGKNLRKPLSGGGGAQGSRTWRHMNGETVKQKKSQERRDRREIKSVISWIIHQVEDREKEERRIRRQERVQANRAARAEEKLHRAVKERMDYMIRQVRKRAEKEASAERNEKRILGQVMNYIFVKLEKEDRILRRAEERKLARSEKSAEKQAMQLLNAQIRALRSGKKKGKGPRGKVSLMQLIRAGLLVPGEAVFSIEYRGRTFYASLKEDGTLVDDETDETFVTPSGWSIKAKRRVMPSKQADDGWKSVKYGGESVETKKHKYLIDRVAELTGNKKSEAEESEEKEKEKQRQEQLVVLLAKKAKLEADIKAKRAAAAQARAAGQSPKKASSSGNSKSGNDTSSKKRKREEENGVKTNGSTPKMRKKKKKKKKGPKGAKSAYMFFCEIARERIKVSHPKATPQETMQMLGTMWKEVSDADKADAQAKAAEDRKRYEKEKLTWVDPNPESSDESDNETVGDLKKKKKKKKKKKGKKKGNEETLSNENVGEKNDEGAIGIMPSSSTLSSPVSSPQKSNEELLRTALHPMMTGLGRPKKRKASSESLDGKPLKKKKKKKKKKEKKDKKEHEPKKEGVRENLQNSDAASAIKLSPASENFEYWNALNGTLKKYLEDVAGGNVNELRSILHALLVKEPASVTILKTTGIGKTVSKLAKKHSDEDVRNLSARLKGIWRNNANRHQGV